VCSAGDIATKRKTERIRITAPNTHTHTHNTHTTHTHTTNIYTERVTKGWLGFQHTNRTQKEDKKQRQARKVSMNRYVLRFCNFQGSRYFPLDRLLSRASKCACNTNLIDISHASNFHIFRLLSLGGWVCFASKPDEVEMRNRHPNPPEIEIVRRRRDWRTDAPIRFLVRSVYIPIGFTYLIHCDSCRYIARKHGPKRQQRSPPECRVHEECTLCCVVLCCVVLCYVVVCCLVLSCLLCCLVLSWLVLSCLMMSCLAMPCAVVCCVVLCCVALCCLVKSGLVLRCAVLSCVVWSYLVLSVSCLGLSCLVWPKVTAKLLHNKSKQPHQKTTDRQT
jgi:hypothetical protein